MQSIDGIEELLEQVPNVDFFGYYTASWSFTAAVLLSMAASSVANISNERPDMSVQHLRERAETFLRKADSCLLRYLHALGYDDGTEDQERYLQYLPVDAVSLHLAVRIGWTRIHCAYAFSADADVVQRYTAEALSGDMTAEEECNRNAVALDTAISASLPLLRSALRIHRKVFERYWDLLYCNFPFFSCFSSLLFSFLLSLLLHVCLSFPLLVSCFVCSSPDMLCRRHYMHLQCLLRKFASSLDRYFVKKYSLVERMPVSVLLLG